MLMAAMRDVQPWRSASSRGREAEHIRRGDRLEDRFPRIRLDGVDAVAQAEFRQNLFDELAGRDAGARRRAAKRGEIADRRASELGQRMADAHDRDQVGHEQFAKIQIWRRVEQAAHGEIEIARFDELEQLGVEGDLKLNLRGRALDDQARKDRLAHQARHEVPGADPDLADLAGPQLFHLPFRIVERGSSLFDPRPQCCANRRRIRPRAARGRTAGRRSGLPAAAGSA